MNKIEKKDIENREDIVRLVDTFYARVRKDELIGPIFNNKIGSHWPQHLQKLYDFWESRLFDKDVYNGRPLMMHKTLPIDTQHFDRWIELWFATIDDLFTGAKASEAKARAQNISSFFQEKLNL